MSSKRATAATIASVIVRPTLLSPVDPVGPTLLSAADPQADTPDRPLNTVGPTLLSAVDRSSRMDCCSGDELLVALLEETLDAGKRASVSAHIETCAVCQERLGASPKSRLPT